ERQHASFDLRLYDYVMQPSAFWTRDAWERTGPLDETLRFAFDWEWFIRAEEAGVSFLADPRILSVYRMHPEHKTAVGGGERTASVGEAERFGHSESALGEPSRGAPAERGRRSSVRPAAGPRQHLFGLRRVLVEPSRRLLRTVLAEPAEERAHRVQVGVAEE